MEDLRHLKIRRGQLKAQLTRFKHYTQECTVENLEQLRERYEKAKSLLSKFEEVQTNIEIKLPEEKAALMENANISIEFEDAYFQALALAKEKLDQHPHLIREEIRNQGAVINNNNKIQVKLPTLTLPTFNGNYEQWLLFKDSFESLINTNENLSEIQKFQYLRSALKEEALNVIQALETTTGNYRIAWDLVKKRYENKRLIINTHLKELFELNSIRKSNHIALRQLVDKIRTHTRALEALSQPINQWDTILIYLAANKLDYTSRKEWEMLVGENSELPKLAELLEFLTNRCQTLEMVEGNKIKQESKFSSKVEKRVLLSSTSNSCEYCKGSHFLYRCEAFLKLTQPSKLKEVKRLQHCINCLKSGHKGKDCTSTHCKHCAKRHNTLLHIEESSNPKTGEKSQEGSSDKAINNLTVTHCLKPKELLSSNKDSITKRERDNDIKPSKQSSSIFMGCTKQPHSQVILSTTQVYVYDTAHNLHKCRALLDPGSHANLITNELVKRLKLPCKKMNISISGIQQVPTNIYKSTTVTLKSTVNNYQTEQEFLVLPKITGKLPQVQIKQH